MWVAPDAALLLYRSKLLKVGGQPKKDIFGRWGDDNKYAAWLKRVEGNKHKGNCIVWQKTNEHKVADESSRFQLNSETQDCKENPVDLYLSMEHFNNKAFFILFIYYVQLLWTLFLVLFWKKHERSRSKMQMDGDWSWFSRREDGWRYWGESEGERHRMIEAQKKDELRQEWSV